MNSSLEQIFLFERKYCCKLHAVLQSYSFYFFFWFYFQLLYCGGSMVQLLITSDIAKYCEFKTITRMLTLLDGKLEKVNKIKF